MAAAAMRRPRHQVLIFHRVLHRQDPMSPNEPTTAWFRGLIAELAAHFEIISLGEAVSRADAGELRGRSLSITFDDGYADNYTAALPVLETFEAPATFFVATDFLDGGRMWNDSIIETFRRLPEGEYEFDLPDSPVVRLSDWDSRRTAAALTIRAWKHLPHAERQARVDALARRVSGLPTDLMMSIEQLRAMAGSPWATVGGHTRSHPILTTLPEDQAREEIAGGKEDLQGWLQREVELFAYPNGKHGRDYAATHAELVKKAGFRAAVATDWGALDAATDHYKIPRFTPWRQNLARFSIDLARCHFGLL
ncbi:MAG: polysaccharide deacetylase family protein [Sedimenticolaceae bacterium]